ncbi:hypothetical protein ACHAW5_007553 [Stephanodiscus triporus]|uniref:Uncharacterized protein n=1 Tax=Stephanodiscus triporus TaxID=2934178 RepID=A0ABD3NJM0_9STRA
MPAILCYHSGSSIAGDPTMEPRDCRSGRRRRLCGGMAAAATAAALMTSTGGALAVPSSPSESNRRRHRRLRPPIRRGLDRDGSLTLANGGTTKTLAPPSSEQVEASSAPLTCGYQQHSLHFEMRTDQHTPSDNSWTLTHASFGTGHEVGNSGLYIDGASVGDGLLGYGAVIFQDVCADFSNGATGHGDPDKSTVAGRAVIVESCYDMEVYDANGDGLTAPHSAEGGLPGGFSLAVDGDVVLEHQGKTCPSREDGAKEHEECALEDGFEYCGARVCTVRYGGAFKSLPGKADTYTVSTLGGSQCKLVQPQCETRGSESTTMPLTIGVKTDSYGGDMSWEVRISRKGDPKRMDKTVDNELLLAGGVPVYHGEGLVIGQLGVGVPLGDNEEYRSTACVPRDDDGACYDFRAYDAYGDGLGCGADGSISILLGDLKFSQRDRDVAKRQKVNGDKKLACTADGERLSRWSLCAVRVCADGEIIGLEGNQCDFGMDDALIDERYADIIPVPDASGSSSSSGLLNFDPDIGGAMVLTFDPNVEVVEKDNEEDVALLDFDPSFDEPEGPKDEKDDMLDFDPSFDEPEGLVTDTKYEVIENEQHDTWAQYYNALDPGFRDDPDTASKDNIPMPKWADLDDERPSEGREKKEPGSNTAELNDQDDYKPEEIPSQGQADQEVPRKPKDKEREKSPLNSKNEQKDNKDDREPRAKSKKESRGEHAENVMGYVSEFNSDSGNGYDNFQGDINVSLDVSFDEEEDRNKSNEPRVKNSNEDQKENKSEREPRAKSKKESQEKAEENAMGYGDSEEVQDITTGDIYTWVDEDTDQGKRSKRRREGQKKRRAKSSKGNSSETESRAKTKKKTEENVMGYVSGSSNENSDSKDGYEIVNGDIHVDVSDEENRGKRSKSEKERKKTLESKPKNEPHEEEELNVMGYVSGSQNKDDKSDSEKGYEIINGNIHTSIRMIGNRDGRHRRMLTSALMK